MEYSNVPSYIIKPSSPCSPLTSFSFLQRNANLNGSSERSSSSKKLQSYWLDACVMSNCTTLAVSTDDLKICFFEIKSSSKICEKFRFTRESCVFGRCHLHGVVFYESLKRVFFTHYEKSCLL